MVHLVRSLLVSPTSKVDARHNTSGRRLPHAVSKAPLNGNLAPFLPPCEGISRCRDSACMHVASAATIPRRSTETSNTGGEPKAIRSLSSSSTRCGSGGGGMFASTLVPACLDTHAIMPACRGPWPPSQPLPNSSLARGNRVDMHRYEMWLLRLMGSHHHTRELLAWWWLGRMAVSMKVSRFNCQVDRAAVGGERLAGMQSSVVIAAPAAGLCVVGVGSGNGGWAWANGLVVVGWVSIVMMLPGTFSPLQFGPREFQDGIYDKKAVNACELLTDLLIARGGGGLEAKFGQADTAAMVRSHCLLRLKLRSCLFRPANRHTGGRCDANGVLDKAEMEVCDGRRGAAACLLLPSSCPPRRLERLHNTTAVFWLSISASFQSSLMGVEVSRCSYVVGRPCVRLASHPDTIVANSP